MYSASSYSLAAYKKPLGKSDLLHLLNRCLFGVGHTELAFFKQKSIEECLTVLLRQSPVPEMLLQEDPDSTDPMVPDGKPWIDAPYENENIDKRRRIYLKSWWVGQIINRDYSLTEKMTLFWHNHFVTEMDAVKDSRYSYRYAVMLRQYALGNFKKLIRQGTTNPAMLVYLNGNTNSKTAPNENYGRELLELFTIGKGLAFNYTEEDVQAAARVLSGWKDNKDTIQVDFVPDLHDTADKQFSGFFNHKKITGKTGIDGSKETDEFIDMIFEKKETALFLCRNLYRWFVCAHADNEAEEKVIAPLADVLMAHNFEIAPVLRTLLSSEHFFDVAYRGCIVKSPVDFMVGAFRQFNLVFPVKEADNHLCWIHYNFDLGGLGMSVGDPPSVAGWPAYYQAPKYHQWWINSYTLSFREKIINRLSAAEGMNCNGPKLQVDFTAFVRQLEKADSLTGFVNECLQLLCAVEISDLSKQKLKAALLPVGQTESQWQQGWNKFMAEPGDAAVKARLDARLKVFFKKLIELPEYQMI